MPPTWENAVLLPVTGSILVPLLFSVNTANYSTLSPSFILTMTSNVRRHYNGIGFIGIGSQYYLDNGRAMLSADLIDRHGEMDGPQLTEVVTRIDTSQHL